MPAEQHRRRRATSFCCFTHRRQPVWDSRNDNGVAGLPRRRMHPACDPETSHSVDTLCHWGIMRLIAINIAAVNRMEA